MSLIKIISLRLYFSFYTYLLSLINDSLSIGDDKATDDELRYIYVLHGSIHHELIDLMFIRYSMMKAHDDEFDCKVKKLLEKYNIFLNRLIFMDDNQVQFALHYLSPEEEKNRMSSNYAISRITSSLGGSSSFSGTDLRAKKYRIALARHAIIKAFREGNFYNEKAYGLPN